MQGKSLAESDYHKPLYERCDAGVNDLAGWLLISAKIIPYLRKPKAKLRLIVMENP